jgi:RNA polymerase sigma-70 factor (ECF subfamily)
VEVGNHQPAVGGTTARSGSSLDVVYRLRLVRACNWCVGGSSSRIGPTVEAGSCPVVAAATGDGFERFYRREYGRVVRLLVGMTGRWAVAEELAQEALLSAYREWPRLQELDRPDLWLRGVAINSAVSTHRRLVAELAALARIRAAQSMQDEELNVDEPVWSEVRKLPRGQAAALVLWAVEGLTFAEIGEVLGCSGETARTHLRRARVRLGSSLRSEVDDDS